MTGGAAVPDDQTATQESPGRGREARDPRHIPAPGWKDVFWRTLQATNEKNLFLVAGGVTYYVLLAIFPGLVALVSVYGLVSDPTQVEKEVNALAGALPQGARQLVGSELHSIVSASGGALSLGAVIGVLFALWSASRGMSGLMSALDIAYGQEETRSFFRFNFVALVLTFASIVGGMIAILLVAGLPAAVTSGGTGIIKWVLLIAEWPVLMVLIMTGLALLYRFAPDRHPPQWRWLTPGAVIATVLWIVGSILFSVYVANFANYNATYGSLGAVVVLLTWMYLSSFVVLLGAQINSESERQTREDTTVGNPKPMGERHAVAADTLGPTRSKS
jgi:membrane protein